MFFHFFYHVLLCIAMYSHVLPCIACTAMYSHVLPCITCIDMYCVYSHGLLRIAIYYPVLLCIAMCSHLLTRYVLSWNKVSELKSLFFCLLHSSGVAQEKALFPNENIVFWGGQRSFRIVNGY